MASSKEIWKANVTLVGFILYSYRSKYYLLDFPDKYGHYADRAVYQEHWRSSLLICLYGFICRRTDNFEWKVGFRSDGLAMSVYNIIAAMVEICTGIFNGLLSAAGYVQPYYDEAGNLIATQTEAVKSAITFGFVGLKCLQELYLPYLIF